MIEWKQAVHDQFFKLQFFNISDMHFETKPPNLMTINFPAIPYGGKLWW